MLYKTAEEQDGHSFLANMQVRAKRQSGSSFHLLIRSSYTYLLQLKVVLTRL